MISEGLDWEVPRGRPRKKEVRIFCLVGGESDPRPSMAMTWVFIWIGIVARR